MVELTNALFVLIAFVVLLWGFERYRSRFIKTDLVIASALAGGLLLLGILPETFDHFGAVLDIDQRVVVVAFLANLVLLSLVLYQMVIVKNTRDELSELTRSISVDQAPQTDGGRETIYVVIPAYNEGETIRSVVRSLPESIRGYEVQPVVVSDGSRDDTVENAQYNGAIVVEHPVNQGQGGALKTGFEISLENDATIVVTMDGDGQHPVSELEGLVSPIIDDEADFVMGSRHKGKDRSGNGLTRKSGIWFFTRMINVLTKSEITDCTNGYRAIRVSGLEEMTLNEKRFSAPELIIEARKNGLQIKEIPITIEERECGETKKPQVGYAIGLARTILATWIR